MTTAVLVPAARPLALPVREVLPWVIFAGLLCILGIYFVGAEEGAVSELPPADSGFGPGTLTDEGARATGESRIRKVTSGAATQSPSIPQAIK